MKTGYVGTSMAGTISDEDRRALEDLDVSLKIVLPEEYQSSYEDVQPVSMGSAPLKYAADGQVAWDEMWASFCDLAMAGGPPHKGTLLEPGRPAAVAAAPDRYDEVVEEITRGITLVTEMMARSSSDPGWVRVDCYSDTMAAWLLRAIVMENVAARADGRMLFLPAAPHFRVEKEIKNVITVIAKTSHYWLGHMPRTQKEAIAVLFASMQRDAPLVEPVWQDERLPERWRRVECPNVRAAIWMMRAIIMRNILSRREGTTLLLPINPATDPGGHRVASAIAWSDRLVRARSLIARD